MAIKNEIVDELLKDVDPKKVFSSEGLLSDIKKALSERMLNAEMEITCRTKLQRVARGTSRRRRTTATAIRRRPSSPTPARWSWRSRAIGAGRSSRS